MLNLRDGEQNLSGVQLGVDDVGVVCNAFLRAEGMSVYTALAEMCLRALFRLRWGEVDAAGKKGGGRSLLFINVLLRTTPYHPK